MKIKHLQLNIGLSEDFNYLLKFLNEQDIDIACIQELGYKIGEEPELKKLVENAGYYFVEAKHFDYYPKGISTAVAIISKWKIVDFAVDYYNSENYYPKIIQAEDLMGEVINDSNSKDRKRYPGSRGIKHALKSRAILTVLVDTGSGLVRIITAHYPVSDLCTETEKMYEMSMLINSKVNFAKSYPTILSGDLNIRAQSYSVEKLEEVLTCHTKDLKDTLSKTHKAKEKDFPEGLAVDHVFSKDLKHTSTEAFEINFSEHKAIVSKFEL
ncbi:hypothetical protein KC660_03890 [Candidatus Dojkabacteria bacterium]|uniref:Endonuclease/exonuclease/phosphatase domain-containing protein n=1 Tax=Candidatus Dojkabacteria bacterium TaxID=2099670 RepID=A0A955L3X8_9BACT|nr:hypothetical protein [Candidatus Dojkabacteria bacterium]